MSEAGAAATMEGITPLHHATELERGLRDVVHSVASVLQLRKQIYSGHGERAASLIPAPIPAPSLLNHGTGKNSSAGTDLIMAARVTRLAAQCQTYLGKSNQLKQWLLEALTAVDTQLAQKLADNPSPALSAPFSATDLTQSADSNRKATGTSTSPAIAQTSPSAIVSNIIDLAGDDDDDELPLGQLRDRTKTSPTKPVAGSSVFSNANASRKRKRTSSSAGTGSKNSNNNNSNKDVVDLTGDSPSPPPSGSAGVRRPSTASKAVKTPASGNSVTKGTPGDVISSATAVSASPLAGGTAAGLAGAATASTSALGGMFSIIQPELELSALHYSVPGLAAAAGPGTANSTKQGKSGASTAGITTTTTTTTKTSSSAAPNPSPSSTAQMGSAKTVPKTSAAGTTITSVPAQSLNNPSTATQLAGASTASATSDPLSGFEDFPLDPEAMAAFSNMDFSSLDLSSFDATAFGDLGSAGIGNSFDFQGMFDFGNNQGASGSGGS